MIIESSTNKDITDVCGKTLSSLHHSCEQVRPWVLDRGVHYHVTVCVVHTTD